MGHGSAQHSAIPCGNHKGNQEAQPAGGGWRHRRVQGGKESQEAQGEHKEGELWQGGGALGAARGLAVIVPLWKHRGNAQQWGIGEVAVLQKGADQGEGGLPGRSGRWERSGGQRAGVGNGRGLAAPQLLLKRIRCRCCCCLCCLCTKDPLLQLWLRLQLLQAHPLQSQGDQGGRVPAALGGPAGAVHSCSSQRAAGREEEECTGGVAVGPRAPRALRAQGGKGALPGGEQGSSGGKSSQGRGRERSARRGVQRGKCEQGQRREQRGLARAQRSRAAAAAPANG